MAVTQAQMDALKEETIAKRKSIADATAQREGALKTSLSDTLASRSTLSNEAKSALSNKQLQSLVDKTPNQRLTSSLTPDQLSGQQAIIPDVTVPKTQELTSALANQIATQPTTQTTQPSSVASNISQGFDEQSKALVQALKQRIAESQQSQKDLISKAPQQYDPLRAQSEVQKAQQLRSVLEQSANVGDRGGVGRQQALLTQTEGANRLNAIDLQQQNFVDQANSEIARLQNEGRYQEAEILANSKAQELQALLGEQVRQEGLASTDLQQQKQDFQYQIMANQNDLQGFANQLQAQGAPQWQVDQVLAARQQKIASQGLDQQGNVIPLAPQGITLSPAQAMDLWAITGRATPEIVAALGTGVQEGDQYSTFASRQPRVTSGSGGGLSTPKVSTTQELADFNALNALLQQGRVAGTEGIQYLADNYADLSAKYGANVVDDMARKLEADMKTSAETSRTQGMTAAERKAEEAKAQTRATETSASALQDNVDKYQSIIRSNYVLDGTLLEDEFLDYVGRLYKTDPEGAKEVARLYGYEYTD